MERQHRRHSTSPSEAQTIVVASGVCYDGFNEKVRGVLVSTKAPPTAKEVGKAVAGLICHSSNARRLWVSIHGERVEIWIETADIDADAELALYGCVDALADRFPDLDIRLHLLHPGRLTLPVELAVPSRAVEIPRSAA